MPATTPSARSFPRLQPGGYVTRENGRRMTRRPFRFVCDERAPLARSGGHSSRGPEASALGAPPPAATAAP